MAEEVKVFDKKNTSGSNNDDSRVSFEKEKSKENEIKAKLCSDLEVGVLGKFTLKHAAKERATHDRPKNTELAVKKSTSLEANSINETSNASVDGKEEASRVSMGFLQINENVGDVKENSIGDEQSCSQENEKQAGNEAKCNVANARIDKATSSRKVNATDFDPKENRKNELEMPLPLAKNVPCSEDVKKKSTFGGDEKPTLLKNKGKEDGVEGSVSKVESKQSLPKDTKMEDDRKSPTENHNKNDVLLSISYEKVALASCNVEQVRVDKSDKKEEFSKGTEEENNTRKVKDLEVGGKSPTFDKFEGNDSKTEMINSGKSWKNREDNDVTVRKENELLDDKKSSSGNLEYINKPYIEPERYKFNKSKDDSMEGGKNSKWKEKGNGKNFDNELEEDDEGTEDIISTKEERTNKASFKENKHTSASIDKFRRRSSRQKQNITDETKANSPGNILANKNQCNKADVVERSTDSDVESNEERTSDANIDNDMIGDGSSRKSVTSVDDSEKGSESEVGFTKRASNDPNFAVVYSFLSLFGGLLNLPECSLDELEQCLDNCNDLNLQAENHGLLEKLHLKLLRRLSRSCKTHFSSLAQVSNDRLIKNLIKFSKYADLDLAWDLEKFGYHVLGSTERLLLLKALCEVHFDENPRFKVHFTDEYIKTDNIEALRLQPTGFDIHGKAIWYQQDDKAGFRIYSIEEDDDDGTSWKLLASTLDDFETLIESLKKKCEVNPKDVALLKRKERKEKKPTKEKPDKGKKKGKGKSTRKKKVVSESESDEEDENPCARCYSNKRPDLVLLCDLCDAAYHTLCLRPPLMSIPEGDWSCPYCQQLALIDVLQEKQKILISRKKALDRVAKRAVFDDIRLSNIVEGDVEDSSSRSGRKRSKIDYNFTSYNEMINSAISTESKRPLETTAISSNSFYRSSRQRKTRNLNDLEEDSLDSGSSDYEQSPSESENHPKVIDEAVSRGCRRSRRLKRKFGDEEKSSSGSESEDDGFVRRSTRRRKPTAKTYLEYESDDTPEEILMKKKSKLEEENDEYVASESEDDPEEIIKVRSRRAIISDEDDDEESIENDVETDLDDDELREEMEKNVISDESEEELKLPSSEEEEEDVCLESTTDDDNYEDESEGEKQAKVKKKNLKEVNEKRKGGKDIRTIIKSIREEEEESAKRSSKSENDVRKPEKKVEENEIEDQETSKASDDEKSIDRDDGNVPDFEKSGEDIDVDIKDVEIRKTEKDIEVSSSKVHKIQQRSERHLSSEKPSNNDEEEVQQTEMQKSGETDAIPMRKKLTLPLKEEEGKVKGQPTQGNTENSVSVKAEFPCSDVPTYTASTGNTRPQRPEPNPSEMIALSSYGQRMRLPFGQNFHQVSSPMMPVPHQPDIVRPRPYSADVMRPTDHYPQSNNSGFSPLTSPYRMRAPYQNFIDQKQFYSQTMKQFPREAPPVYPGYPGSPQQPVWRPQTIPPMQWNYPTFRGISPQEEHKHQQMTMYRPYLDVGPHVKSGSASGKSAKTQKQQSRLPSMPHHPVDSSSRRPKNSFAPVDSRKPTATESYAAFQNMVITPAGGNSQKKTKGS